MKNQDTNQMIEALYLEMYHKLFLYARCTLKNDALSEEAVQETFRIACTKPEALEDSPNPRGWLLNTLKNVISNTVHSRMLASRILNDYILCYAKEMVVSEESVDFELLYQDIAMCEEYRLLKEMVIDGKSYLEMAESRGISVVACRKRVQRAKETLRNRINTPVLKENRCDTCMMEGGI